MSGLERGYQPNAPAGIVVYSCIFLLVIALTVAFAWCVERRTAAIRAYLRTRLLGG